MEIAITTIGLLSVLNIGLNILILTVVLYKKKKGGVDNGQEDEVQ